MVRRFLRLSQIDLVVLVLPGIVCTYLVSGVPGLPECLCSALSPRRNQQYGFNVVLNSGAAGKPLARKTLTRSLLRGVRDTDSEAKSTSNGRHLASNSTAKQKRSIRRGGRISGAFLRRPQVAQETQAASSRRLAGVAGLSGLVGFELGRRSELADDSQDFFDEILAQLQGDWEDEIGIAIRITGDKAAFSDDPDGNYFVEDVNGVVVLREASLISLGDTAVWRFPWGLQHQWQRLTIAEAGDDQWDEVFRQYKSDRLELWQFLCVAAQTRDDRTEDIQRKWQDGGPLPLSPLTLLFRSRLLAGQNLVPGVCFVHRRFGYRGVIVGHESKCLATPRWKANMGIDSIPGGEKQPYYHCIVDDRDRPGGQTTYVAEVNIVPNFSERAFPIQCDLVQELFIKCEELPGYRPGRQLQEMLRKQRENGGRFIL
eukprot:TRINITY_DN54245_c0_g1_i1.p1 TRINITY_DN54245_c0_g1~~TRINITY_DN54245_c0_g1_i1.p1  ORF type:complete len:428 (-),score=27.21 TRINITY_DN54245_c0_g1_i1:36-1319(-)